MGTHSRQLMLLGVRCNWNLLRAMMSSPMHFRDRLAQGEDQFSSGKNPQKLIHQLHSKVQEGALIISSSLPVWKQ